MLFILSTSDLSLSLLPQLMKRRQTLRPKVGKTVFKENWPSQQFFIILFHAMNGNKNQKPLWFKWSS